MSHSGFAGSRKLAAKVARSLGDRGRHHVDDIFSGAGVLFIGAGLAMVSVALALVVVGMILLVFGIFLGIVFGSAGSRRQPRRE